ncbi:hypothetical protein PJ912_26890 [Pectobacterium colocasium]|uniref:hypothetical protein n=1 Tax=Pectobacterium TaxID=122277 RepID=UPI003D752C1E
MRHGWRNPSAQGCVYSVFTIYPLSPLDRFISNLSQLPAELVFFMASFLPAVTLKNVLSG